MPGILHLIDASDPQELRLALAPLLSRLPSEQFSQQVLLRSGRRRQFSFLDDRAVRRLAVRLNLNFLSAARLRSLVIREGIDLVHAWSVDTACFAAMACPQELPIALSLWNPHLSPRDRSRIQLLNAHAHAGVLCQAQMVRRRLVEHGLDPARCAVIRPGVDFGVINQLKREAQLRDQLGITGRHHVLLMPAPPTRRGGHMYGMWTMDVVRRCDADTRLLLPGVSTEQNKILRYARRAGCPAVVLATGERYPFESLLAVADLLLVPAVGDISSTSISWAMAGSVPVLGSANYCVTEFVAHRVNGFVVKPRHFVDMAGEVMRLRRERELTSRVCDVARGQAFEAFGLTRYVQQVQHAYENLLDGAPVGQGMEEGTPAPATPSTASFPAALQS